MIRKCEFNFIRESNRIEGITRHPTNTEVDEFNRFMGLKKVSIEALERFVSVYEPGAKLRSEAGMDVRVGNYTPPPGGLDILQNLGYIIGIANNPPHDSYDLHLDYEHLHPFTDCNGRSGRMLWAWQQRDLSLGFLHRFYYQALSHEGK